MGAVATMTYMIWQRGEETPLDAALMTQDGTTQMDLSSASRVQRNLQMGVDGVSGSTLAGIPAVADLSPASLSTKLADIRNRQAALKRANEEILTRKMGGASKHPSTPTSILNTVGAGVLVQRIPGSTLSRLNYVPPSL